MVECLLCYSAMENPKILPCMHSFCLKCISIYFEKNDKASTCPICKLEFEIPKNDCNKLQSNIFIIKLHDVILSYKEKLNKICQICEVNRYSNLYCCDCHKLICNACKLIHKSISNTSNHKILNYEDAHIDEISKAESTVVCKLHDKKLKIYCKECELPICLTCLLTNHKNHKLCELSEATLTIKKGISTAIIDINNKIEKINLVIKMSSNHLNDIVKRCDLIENLIKKNREKLIALINEKTEKLLEELCHQKEDILFYYKENQNHMKFKNLKNIGLKNYASSLLKNGSVIEMVLNGQDIINKAFDFANDKFPDIYKKFAIIYDDDNINDISLGNLLKIEIIPRYLNESTIVSDLMFNMPCDREVVQSNNDNNVLKFNSSKLFYKSNHSLKINPYKLSYEDTNSTLSTSN